MQSSNDISSIIDGIFFSFVIATVLLGLTVVHGWIYMHNNRDRWPMRTFVVAIVLLDIAETCLMTQLLHYYLINHYGDVPILSIFPWTISAGFVVAGLIVLLVHIFFASRLFLLGKRLWFPALIVACSFTMLGLCISTLILQRRTDLLASFRDAQLKIQLTAYHILSVSVDILVTIGLSSVFSPGKMEITETRSIVQQLLVYTLTRGFLITLVQVGHITMYLLRPSNLLFWMSFHLILSKLYVITTLVILNSRNSRQEKFDDVVTAPLSFAFDLEAKSYSANEVKTSADSDHSVRRMTWG